MAVDDPVAFQPDGGEADGFQLKEAARGEHMLGVRRSFEICGDFREGFRVMSRPVFLMFPADVGIFTERAFQQRGSGSAPKIPVEARACAAASVSVENGVVRQLLWQCFQPGGEVVQQGKQM